VENNPLRYTDPTGHFKINIGKALNRIFDSNVTRAVGWVLMPYYMPYVDPYTRTTAVSESAGFVVGMYCPICGAAVSGAIRAAIDQSEGKRANILKSAAASAAAAAVTDGLDVGLAKAGMNKLISHEVTAEVTRKVIAHAGGEVVGAQIQGGNLLQAAITGGVTGLVTGALGSVLPEIEGKKDRSFGEALYQDLLGGSAQCACFGSSFLPSAGDGAKPIWVYPLFAEKRSHKVRPGYHRRRHKGGCWLRDGERLRRERTRAA
jgi:hypothetical protein